MTAGTSITLVAIALAASILGIYVIWRRSTARLQPAAMAGHGTLSETRLNTVMDTSPVGILLVDPTGVVHDANRASIELFGYGDDLIGMQVEQLVPTRWRTFHAEHRESYVESPAPRAMGSGRDLTCLDRKGNEIPVEIALTPLPQESLIMATVVDITERRRLLAQLEQHAHQLELSNKELDSFAYIASHDLKSPLRGIQNLSQFIEEDLASGQTDQIEQHMNMLRGRVARMDRLLDDLLQYSRVGRGNEDVKSVDVAELVSEIANTLAVPEGLVVTCADDVAFPTYRIPLDQALRNLIHNSIKHHDTGRGEIRVTVDQTDRPGYRVFAVEDDGPGIPEEFRDRVFRMFTTLAPRDEIEGSGIGLALVKKLVERYGGRIDIVEPKCGHGARIEFTWPEVHP